MVRACLREKVGLFYIVISYYDEQHKRRQIWIPTKLKTKGNKRKAQSMLDEYKYYYDVEKRQLVYESAVRKANMGRTEILQESKTLAEEPQLSNGVLFGDYIYQWNEDNKNSLQATTYDGYKSQIIRSIQPYFNARGITLLSITADDIRLYYKILIRKVSASTVRRYHSNIRKCLQEAFEDDKIQSNPADKVKLPNVDVYITGSNAKFLSSEIATLLTGRYVEINVLPLSFKEYYEHFKNNGKDKRMLFMDYITYGALPGIFMFETGSVEQREYMESVYKTILEKDVLKRNSAASKQLVENLLSYLVYNIGCLTSTKRITDTLNSNGTKVSYNTVDSYFETLQDCFFVYKADRYDVVGKEYLKLINKYYVTDFGFKYYILNNKTVELSQILENLIFLELKRRRYKVATGKVAEKEVDFIIKDRRSEFV